MSSAHDVGLYRVDPITLEPAPGTDPITTGDWMSGSLSDNGEWLVLNVWIDSEPDIDAVRVVEVSTGRVVTDLAVPLMHSLAADDQGTVFSHMDGPRCGGMLGQLPVGGESFEVVFDDFPVGFCPWTNMNLMDDHRIGWLGVVDPNTEDSQTALMLVDVPGSTADLYPVPGITMGLIDEHPMGDWLVPEMLTPAVVWDSPRNRALVVHADEPRVTVVDLNTGEVEEHSWDKETWVDSLLAWLIPPAHAKGPSLGIDRSAVLSNDGSTLYVATLVSDMVTTEGVAPYVDSVPQGVEVIDTNTWSLVDTIDVPVSEVELSPDGAFLVATGTRMQGTTQTSTHDPEGAFLFRTDTLEQVGSVDTAAFADVQFSADSMYVYLTAAGGPIRVVRLENGELIELVNGSSQQTVFGEASMLSTPILR